MYICQKKSMFFNKGPLYYRNTTSSICSKLPETTGITGFHQMRANFRSSQNTGENGHFTGNIGITGGLAMPVLGLSQLIKPLNLVMMAEVYRCD